MLRVVSARFLSLWLGITCASVLTGCGINETLLCGFKDIPKSLTASDSITRGQAAECAMRASPSKNADWLPVMLPLISDGSVFKTYQSSGGLIGFGEAGTRQLSVAMPAKKAIARAEPRQEHIDELVAALVNAANRVRPQARGSALHGEPEDVAYFLIEQLATKYLSPSGNPRLAQAMRDARSSIVNSSFWENQDFAREWRDLESGRVPYPWNGRLLP